MFADNDLPIIEVKADRTMIYPQRMKLTVQAGTSYYIVEDDENFTELGASAYWKTSWMSLAGGSNLYTAKSGTYASFRLAPTAYLPHA